MLDAAEELLIGRVVGIDDRRAVQTPAIDQQVDRVAALGRAVFRGALRRALLVRDIFAVTGAKQRGVFNDVGLDGVHESEHLRQALELIADVLGHIFDGDLGDAFVQLRQVFLRFPRPGRHLAHDLAEHLLEAPDFDLYRLAFGFWQRVVDIGRNDFAVRYGREYQSAFRLRDGNALLFGRLLHRRECRFLALLQRDLNSLPFVAVVVALEHRGDDGSQIVNERVECATQFRARTGGQPERLGLVRAREVVDVAPIVRHGLLRRFRAQ